MNEKLTKRLLLSYPRHEYDDQNIKLSHGVSPSISDDELLFLKQIGLRAARVEFQAAEANLDAAIASLNRATLSDTRLVSAWNLLTLAYLQRAATATVPEKADADYLNAVRAGEGLTRVRTDAPANVLFAQALIGAKQFPRAATVLERFATAPDASPSALYLLGVAESRAKNFPTAISALERAAAKTPDDANIYRELGYAYEVSKQYAKALAVYEKGASLAPNDADFKESAERVRGRRLRHHQHVRIDARVANTERAAGLEQQLR